MVIRNISDTARWVAIYRAMESERPDALFHDPYARRLGGERGEAIVRALPYGAASSWAMVVRTAVFDEIILRLVRDSGEAPTGGPNGSGAPVTGVLNLACGLDTRPYRLPLPPDLRWTEVDLPAILDEKEAALAGERPACRLERVRLDLADREARRTLFAQVGVQGGTTLVVTEGLVIYLAQEDVAGLATDLAAQPALRWWLLDFTSPLILKYIRRSWGRHLAAGNAPMRFAPQNGAEFFRPYGWEPAEMRPLVTEARRLHRTMPQATLRQLLFRLIPGARRQVLRAGTALLERRSGLSPEPA